MTILVPVDESTASRAAIDAAVAAAQPEASDILLVTVAPLPETSDQRDEALAALGKRLERIGHEISDVPVRWRVSLAGDPVRGILEVAAEEHVHRIFIGHDDDEHPAVDALFGESVTEEVREQAPVPVTVICS